MTPRSIPILLLLTLGLSACFRKDKKITLPPPGNAQVAQAALGSDYATQVFFSLKNGAVLSNEMAAWDLAFESSSSGYHVWVNGGKGMQAARLGTLDFIGKQDTVGARWRWDAPSGNPDSTAVGNWLASSTPVPNYFLSAQRTDGAAFNGNGNVCIVDRGASYTNFLDRYWKIVFQSADANEYHIRFGKLDNSFVDMMTLSKDAHENYTYFTFDGGGHSLVMEPTDANWDFVFTRYRYVFYTTPKITPYVVTGALLNPSGTTAVLDSTHAFADVTYNLATTLTLSSARDAIGYRWKTYNFSTEQYTVNPKYVYVLRDRDGYYWKLHFLDFYNDQGQKGYPKFEYQRL